MAKHTILGSFVGANIQYIRPFIEVDWEQNLAQNSSTVTASLYFERYTGNYWSYNELTNSNGHSCTFSVGGNSLTQIRPFNLQRDDPPNSVLIWTRTRTINHNTNGTASVNISASGDTNVNPRNYDFGETVTLPTIPRQTEINSVSMNNQLRPSVSNSLTVSLDRKHSSYTHRFEIMNGSTVLQSSTGGLVTSVNVADTTVNKMIDLMKTVKTRKFTLRVVTLNGTTVIGSKTKDFSVTLNDNYTSPTIKGDYHVILGSGHDFDIGKYVQNISRMRVVFGADYGRGAERQSMSATVDGKSASGIIISDGRYRADSQTLTKSGTVDIVVTATNSRGQSTSKPLTATVHAYRPPAIQEFSGYRSDSNETNVLITRKYSRSWLGGDNVPTVKIEKRLSTATSWTTINTAGDLDLSATSTNNLAARSYVFRTVIEDKFGRTATAEFSVGTARVLMEKYKDEGVSFGKRFETGKGTLQVMGDIQHVTDGGVVSNITSPVLVTPPLQNGWTKQLESTYGTPGYQKVGGIIYLKGFVGHSNPQYRTSIFMLPEGCRPLTSMRYTIPISGGDVRNVNVLPSGHVRYETSNTSEISWLVLDSISFAIGG